MKWVNDFEDVAFSWKLLDYTSFGPWQSKNHIKTVFSIWQSVGLFISLSTVFSGTLPISFFGLLVWYLGIILRKNQEPDFWEKINFCQFRAKNSRMTSMTLNHLKKTYHYVLLGTNQNQSSYQQLSHTNVMLCKTFFKF